jgi:hypothetical protein
MAHEIAHVTARHGTRQATKGQIANYASIPLAIFLPGGWLGYGVYQGVQLAVPLTFLKFSRGYEKEADLLGLQYLYKSGYDPTSMITFFERIQAQQKRKKSAAAKMFASHPPTSKRIELIQDSMGEILPARPQYTINTSEFQEVRDRLNKLTRRMRNAEEDPNKPTLRRSPGEGTIDVSEEGDDPGEPADDRPTLKRIVTSDEEHPNGPREDRGPTDFRLTREVRNTLSAFQVKGGGREIKTEQRWAYQRGSRRPPKPPPPPPSPRSRPRPPPPPPPPPVARGRASLMFNARPLSVTPFNCSIAASPSSSFGISQKPNPRGRPVSRSVIRLTRSTVPNCSNS